MENIKEKVLKEVQKTYGILNNQFVEINHKKLGNTTINVELPLDLAIDLTLAEVIKIIDKDIAFWSRHGDTLTEPLKELKKELGIK